MQGQARFGEIFFSLCPFIFFSLCACSTHSHLVADCLFSKVLFNRSYCVSFAIYCAYVDLIYLFSLLFSLFVCAFVCFVASRTARAAPADDDYGDAAAAAALLQ